MKALSVILASLVSWVSITTAQNITVNKTVNGASGPWSWENGGLNTAYQYANEYGNFGIQPPTTISATDGFRFSVGDTLTITYLSGNAEGAYGGTPVSASGYLNSPLDNILAGTYGPGPSYYMNPATYHIYNMELVGTFANSSGQIVGTPFAVGLSGTFAIPAGATQLELGANDNNYGDNSGSWNIQVTGIPEPATWSLLALGLVAILGGRRVRRRS